MVWQGMDLPARGRREDGVMDDPIERALLMTRDRLLEAITNAANSGFIAGMTGDVPLEVKSRAAYHDLKPWLEAVGQALAALKARNGGA
jgi:hypothetical protein